MFFTQGIYDVDELCQINMHIHTNFSGCASEEMSFENIIETAQKANLKMIALVDHIYRPDKLPEFVDNCKIMKNKLALMNPDIKVLIGGEFSSYGTDEYTLKDVEIDTDYRLYAQNHFHVTGWQQAEDGTPEGFKELTKKMLRTLFKNKAADTIAHPFTGQYLVKKMGWDYDTLGKAWSDNELGDILKEGFDSGCAWEINTVSVHNDPQLVRRIYNIGKEIGVVFTLGTDAHKLLNVDPKNFIDEIKKVLY